MDALLPDVGLGTAAIAGLYHAVDRARAERTIETAWTLGIRYFDTAPHYGQGKAERILGDVLRGQQPGSYVISTKVGRVLTPDANPPERLNGFVEPLPFRQDYDYSHDGVMRSYEDSLQRLGLNRIDILFVHDIGVRTHGEANAVHMHQLRSGGFRALEELKRSGAIRAFGIGVNEVEICTEILAEQPLDLILLAGRYTLLDRSAEAGLLDLCAATGTRLVIGGVFNSGILATGARAGAHWDYGPAPEPILRKVRALSDLCRAYGVDLPRAALQFPKRHAAVASVLLGNGAPDRLQENLDALRSADLPERFWRDAAVIVD